MSLIHNQTGKLRQIFMPRRNDILNAIGSNLFAFQTYKPTYFETFNPNIVLKKKATLDVTDFDSIPSKMESFTLPGCFYAVFEHKGQSTTIFNDIFNDWIPNSEYELDHRPPFELLGSKYKKEIQTLKKKFGYKLKRKGILRFFNMLIYNTKKNDFNTIYTNTYLLNKS